MSELIDRQAAIEALRTCQTYLFDIRDPDKKICLESAIYELEALPSVQPDPMTLRVDRELTKEEYDKLMQDIKDAPVVLLPFEQPDRKPGEWLHDILQDAIDANEITETQAIGIMWRAQHKGERD